MAEDSPAAIEQAIAAAPVGKLKLLYPAFLVGPIALIAAGLFLGSTKAPPEVPEAPVLVYAALGVSLITAAMAFLILPKVMFEAHQPKMFAGPDPLSSFLALLMTLRLVQGAALEGAALLGAVAIFVGSQENLLESQPIHWAAITPVLVFLVFIALYTPTDRGIAEEYERAKQRHLS